MSGNRLSTSFNGGTNSLVQAEEKKAMGLLALPMELLLGLFQRLDARSLASLCGVCRSLHHIMVEAGWRDYCKGNYRPTPSVSERWDLLSWRERARETYQTNLKWSRQSFVAKSLSNHWGRPYRPVLALSSKRLVVAAGNTITSYRFEYDLRSGRSMIEDEGTYSVFRGNRGDTDAKWDITGVTFLPDGKDETLLVSNEEGALVRIKVLGKDTNASGSRHRRQQEMGSYLQASKTAAYDVKIGPIRTLTSSGAIALAVSECGRSAVINTTSPWITPSIVNTGKLAWASHLQLSSATPYMALGTSNSVSVYSFSDGVLRASPSAELGGPLRVTPVYCVSQYIPGGSPDIIASGWYDGKVRIHDLRCSQRTWSNENGTTKNQAALAPVITLSDPWRSFDPIYSLAARSSPSMDSESGAGTGGLPHYGHYLIAGTALHAAVCLWDVRKPDDSWSLFAPGQDRSPVYSLKAEGSRIWGVTERRAFIIDFTPNASSTRYPQVTDHGAHNAGKPYLHRYGSSTSIRSYYDL